MKALLQRVRSAAVDVDQQRVAEIGQGLLVFLGVADGDNSDQVRWLADKTLGLRIFADYQHAMNRSLIDISGEILVVSQFTLAADTNRGKRPGFSSAAAPDVAERLYDEFVAVVAQTMPVQTGRFGADMQISLVNDGPVTFMLER